MEFVLAIHDPETRARVLHLLRSVQIEPAAVGDPSQAYRLTPHQLNHGWLILETGENAHRLTQIVNDLHHSADFLGGCVRVTCLVSPAMFELNPTLAWWLIEGGAAVGTVWLKTMPEDEMARGFRSISIRWLRPDDPDRKGPAVMEEAQEE